MTYGSPYAVQHVCSYYSVFREVYGIWNTTQCIRAFFNNAVFQYHDFICYWEKIIINLRNNLKILNKSTLTTNMQSNPELILTAQLFDMPESLSTRLLRLYCRCYNVNIFHKYLSYLKEQSSRRDDAAKQLTAKDERLLYVSQNF